MTPDPLQSKSNRRRFLRSLGGAATLPWYCDYVSVSARAQKGPNSRVTLGVVGVGGRGLAVMRSFLRQNNAQVVAVCDVDRRHHRANPIGTGPAMGLEPARDQVNAFYASALNRDAYDGCAAYLDYRDLCAREDIDAVLVATPDHWHALICLEALRHGKDIYCEKPITHRFQEGLILHKEVALRQAIFQTGSQQRSAANFRRAVELVRNGAIGAVRNVEVGLPTGFNEPRGDTTIREPRDTLDYNFWLGPAPELPLMTARFHQTWRGHSAFGGGSLMDWIGHHNDIAHWGLDLDTSGPTRVEAKNWTFPETDVYDTPVDYDIHLEYPNGVQGLISNRLEGGTKWIGDDGWIWVNRGKLETSDPRWKEPSFDPGPIKVKSSDDHVRDFLECVASREPCVAPAETAHRSITPGHLGAVSNALQRPLKWDAGSEQILDDPEADALLRKIDYREPWSLSSIQTTR